MEFVLNTISLPVFVFFMLIFTAIAINILPYLFISKADSLSEQILCSTITLITFISLCIGGLWFATEQFFLISILTLSFSYVHFCSAMKKELNLTLYTIVFIIISVFFSVWITVMFGKYYFENKYIIDSNYTLRYKAICEEDDWTLVYYLKQSILFFKISFGKYFTLPDEISLKNPFFIQSVFGLIISGTIISWAIDGIKHFVTPSKSN